VKLVQVLESTLRVVRHAAVRSAVRPYVYVCTYIRGLTVTRSKFWIRQRFFALREFISFYAQRTAAQVGSSSRYRVCTYSRTGCVHGYTASPSAATGTAAYYARACRDGGRAGRQLAGSSRALPAPAEPAGLGRGFTQITHLDLPAPSALLPSAREDDSPRDATPRPHPFILVSLDARSCLFRAPKVTPVRV
jgi:hypothetical protein